VIENRGPGLRMPAFSVTSVNVPSPLFVVENVGVARQTARTRTSPEFPSTDTGRAQSRTEFSQDRA